MSARDCKLQLLVAVLLVPTLVACSGSPDRTEQEDAAVQEIVADAKAISDKLRCIEDRAWMRVAPEAQEAEEQARLVARGLPPTVDVDPAVKARLAAAKACSPDQ